MTKAFKFLKGGNFLPYDEDWAEFNYRLARVSTYLQITDTITRREVKYLEGQNFSGEMVFDQIINKDFYSI